MAWFLVWIGLLGNTVSGDEYFVQINYPAALQAYNDALVISPEDPEVLWRLARVHICIGDVSPDDERDAHYRQAEAYARKAIAINPSCSDAHTFLAATLGSIAMSEGSRTKVRLCREVKKELDRAVKLNPNDDIAYSILGSFYRALGNISWLERSLANLLLGGIPSGGFEESEAALKKAIVLAPNSIRHRFELGRLYMDMDRTGEAMAMFRTAQDLPVTIASDVSRLKRIDRILTQGK